MQKKSRLVGLLAFFVFVFSLAIPVVFVNKAEAAGFQQSWLRLDRMAASTFTSGLACVKTPVIDTAGTENDVQVVFPSDFTVSATLTDWAVSTAAIPFGTTAWPGIAQATAANNTTKTVTFPSTALSTNTTYCFQWTNTSAALQTGAAGNDKTGTVTTRTSGPAAIDTSSYATAVISNDQVVVTATVPSTFSFSLSGNTDTFAGALSTTAQLSNGVTATIATNAASGWVAWVKSANAALNSVSTGASIATLGTVNNTVDTLTSSNYGYLLDVTFTDSGTGTGTVTQAANYGQEYDGNSSNSGGTLSTAFQPVAASSGTTDNDTVVLKALARITAIQAAATDYTDTLTVVAAGRF
ncbi:MAG: hypothetical protein KBB51_00965 [Candidatus Moranbacteria bacterium]|jgi:hypothetical protein|nr:hypothetical protein [Candidatus Moranbacteria bacterium]